MRFSFPAVITGLLGVVACGGTEPGAAPFFPSDYEGSYTEVRNCRPSADHDLNVVRVLADDAALEAYEDRDTPFPEGAVVLKEEYDFSDTTCEGPIVQWTVMQRLAEGTEPTNLDWAWQTVRGDRSVEETDPRGCVGCHAACGDPPDGYEGTCTVP